MQRHPVVIGNWKMELSHKGSVEVALSLKKMLKTIESSLDVVVCPSYPALAGVQDALKNTAIHIGAQHVHWEERGAWTGQVSVTQISPFCTWCIVGHSEQRALTHETENEIQAQALLLLKHGLTPIICIGESQEEHEAQQTIERVSSQVQNLLSKMTRTALSQIIIVYEPIWAIGSGNLPDPVEVTEIMLLIRKLAAGRFGNEAADRLRIIYGGSVKPQNVAPYVAEPGIDGVLVGGASIHPGQFVDIIKAVQAAR